MSNSQKIPFALSQQNLIQNSIEDRLQGLGQVLPCTIIKVEGAIVTVNFNINNLQFTPPPVRCASISSRYLRLPLQIGDSGICVAANTRLGGVNGLGLGVAPLANPSNLGGLVFLPIGNINWPMVDPNAVVITAKNGGSISTDDANSKLVVTTSGILLQFGTNSITINSTGITLNGNVFTTGGSLTINGNAYLAHAHSGVQPGGSNTGGVV